MEEPDCTVANSTDSYTIGMNVFRGLICSVGVLGNIVVIFVIVILKEYQQAVTHWYVLQLSIADICFLLTLPFAMLEADQKVWTLSDGVCKLKDMMLYLNYYASVLFLIVMSIDRYIAVCCAFSPKLQKLRKKKAAYIITIAVWVISLACSIPVIVFTGKKDCQCGPDFPSNHDSLCLSEGLQPGEECEELLRTIDENYTTESLNSVDLTTADDYFGLDDVEYSGMYGDSGDDFFEMGCSYHILPNGFKAYIYFNFIVMFVIPSLCMIICYTLIVSRLKNTRMESSHNKKNDRNRIRVTILCLVLVALFIICWLPFHAQHLAKMTGISGAHEHCKKVASVTNVFIFLNSALNPYVYNFIGRRFTMRLRRAAGSVKTTIRRSTHSFSGDKTIVKYNAAKKERSMGDATKQDSMTGSTRLNSKRSSDTTDNRMSIKVETTNLVVHEDFDKKIEE